MEADAKGRARQRGCGTGRAARRAAAALAAAGLCMLLAGCATPASSPARGDVGMSEVDSAVPAETRMHLADNETFQAPLPDPGNLLPQYPDALLVQRLPPQQVCVRVGIGRDGRVVDTAPVSEGPDCPEPGSSETAFFQAAADAARRWRFEPAFRCIYPEGTRPPDAGCWGEGVREEPVAVSLVYRFVFTQVDGRAAVRMGL